MRLPQSSSQPLCVRVVSIASVMIFAVLLGSARAATQQLTISPASLKFGTVTVGQTEAQLVALVNNGQTSVTVTAVNATVAEFGVPGLKLPLTLAAGQSVSLNVAFAPTAAGWTKGTVTFTSNASNSSLQVPVAGSGVTSEALTATPSSLSFGQVALGSSSTLPVVLTNARNWKETLTSLQMVGTGFSVSGATFPVTLTPGQSLTLSVTFTPQAAGPTGGSIFVSGVSQNIPLTGTGTSVGQLTLTPSVNFGSVAIGTTTTQPSTMSASGGSVTVMSAASSNSQFTLSGASFPLTINSGQSVQFDVSFTPQTAGTSSASLSFTSNASNSHSVESLSGTGTTPVVSLTWTPSTSQVSGYNIYRGTVQGIYAKINSTLDTSTAYMDRTVTSGTIYYYAATAVASTGQESTYSLSVAVAIP